MNILITAAGRSNFLLRRFREALGENGHLFATDTHRDAPALRESHRSFLVPRYDDPTYVDVLLAICENCHVDLLVSLLEPELALIARDRSRFEQIGTFPLVPDGETIELCQDKFASYQFLEHCGIATPRTYASLRDATAALGRAEVSFPVVLKRRWGFASLGLEFPANAEELALAYNLALLRAPRVTAASRAGAEDPVLIQERVTGDEYGLDVVNDLQGRYVTTLVRQKLRMRAGNTDRAMTVEHAGLSAVGRQIGERLGHVGSIDCDVIEADGQLHVLDLNPRIGGGLPFSMLAGADLPAALLAWRRGEQHDPSWLTVKPNVVVSKYDEFILVN